MSYVEKIPPDLRTKDIFHHIDMGFVNRRLCMTALPASIREYYFDKAQPGDDHFTKLRNDHLLVTMLLDVCDAVQAPTLLQALALGMPKHLFRSTERLAACPDVYETKRVSHNVILDVDFGKPVRIAYHTKHLVSDTGTMTLAEGAGENYVQSIIGLVHDRPTAFEIEPLVIGAPWLDHPRNGDTSQRSHLMWMGREFGEILPEDIEQFSELKSVSVSSADEWMSAMRELPEEKVKTGFAALLNEPTKKDWGGEIDDHFSSSLMLGGRRRTAAFLFKGPTNFREMTMDLLGKRADQIFRLTNSGADVFIVQHCHQIGESVRATLRSMTFFPGNQPRKYCFIDGQATYRIFKAYNLL